MSAGAIERVALWGYGAYGHAMHEHLCMFWKDRYSVSAVFDVSPNLVGTACQYGEIRVSDVSELEHRYAAHEFDSVIVCIIDAALNRGANERLAQLGIPSTTLDDWGNFRSWDEFDAAECPLPEAGSPDLHLYEFKNIYGVPSQMERRVHSLLYLYDGAGKVVRENWYSEDAVWDPCLVNTPIPLDAPPADARFLAGEYCTVGRVWSRNYWHFTFQMASQIAFMEDIGFRGTYLVPKPPFAESIIEFMGIDTERILWLDEFPSGGALQFERIFVLEQDSCRWDYCPEAVQSLSRRVGEYFSSKPQSRPYARRLFVERIGSRRLKSGKRLLKQYGFETMIPEECSVAEQIARFHAADVVLSPHGANCTNAAYMRPGTAFIETFGRTWAFPCVHDALLRMGVHYLPVVQTPIIEDIKVDQTADYWVDPAILESAIRSALALTESLHDE